MNLQTLTKEQKQKFALIGIGTFLILFVIVQFVVKPFYAQRAQATEEYNTLRNQLDAAQQAVRNETSMMANLQGKGEELKQALNQHIPNSENSLSWATKKIYVDARSVGVDIESVTETDVDTASWTSKDQAKRVFKPYGVRIAMQCSFFEIVKLVRVLEESNPYLNITGITISSQITDFEKHQVSLIIEWPNWKDLELPKKLEKKFEDNPA